MASRKKPSAAQLRARAKFSKIMKSGGFKKRKSKTTITKSKRKRRTRRISTTTHRVTAPRRRPTRRRRPSTRPVSRTTTDAKKMKIVNTVMRLKLSKTKKLSILRTLDKVI